MTPSPFRLRRQALSSANNKTAGSSDSGTLGGIQGEWPTMNTAGLKRGYHPGNQWHLQ